MTARTNLVLDLGITAAFLVISNPPLTGMAVHEWLGAALGVGMLTHVVFHWEWVAGISARLFGRLKPGTRLNYFVDVLLFATFTAAVLSGVLISKHLVPWFGVQFAPSRAWQGIHHFTANLSIVAVAVHVGLHWSWVATQFRKLSGRSAARAKEPGLSPLSDGAPV